MAENWFNQFWSGNNKQKNEKNSFNEAFLKFFGVGSASYDYKSKTYLEKGYKINPIVFSVVDQMCNKSKLVPFYVRKIKDKKAYEKLRDFEERTKGVYSPKQLIERKELKAQAYEEKEMPFPLDRPNPNQTWKDIISLYKLYRKTTGNFYWLNMSTDDGINKGVPKLVYVLPSDKTEFVLKNNTYDIYDENPIDYYKLTEGDVAIKFDAKNVIHVKTPNPFYSQDGSHLYGLSPMTSLTKNIEASNNTLENNVKSSKNRGVFGFFFGKDSNLTPEQATQFKQKLVEMDKSPDQLSRIAGSSTPLEFTRLSLTTDELKPFDFLNYDERQICNVFGWSTLLLNRGESMTYNNIKEERKRVVLDNIKPDLDDLADALNENFIQKFKGYENCVVEFDISELPEMQEDIKEMVEWMGKAYLSPNEIRLAVNYETNNDVEGMDVPRDPQGKRVDEISINETDVNKSYNG